MKHRSTHGHAHAAAARHTHNIVVSRVSLFIASSALSSGSNSLSEDALCKVTVEQDFPFYHGDWKINGRRAGIYFFVVEHLAHVRVQCRCSFFLAIVTL